MITQARLDRARSNLRTLGTSNINAADLATLTGSLAAPEARTLALVALLSIRSTEADLNTHIDNLADIITELNATDDDGQDDTAEEAGE